MPERLACYAVTEKESRGRRYAEKPHPYRDIFERDRDRIIHSYSFRRLEGKTQVFMPGVNDHYRTRLTHSIEVAQIARTIARALKLNEPLTEAVCLAHDLGHSPFGHTGEIVLDELMYQSGGFEHNRQTMRIIELLEHPYPEFTGLNLTYETRLALTRHHSPYDRPAADTFREINCSLEGQVADIADRIAYNCHDLEDGMRSELISEAQVKEKKLYADAQEITNTKTIHDDPVRRLRNTKSIIDALVSDCITASAEIITSAKVKTVADVYHKSERLIVLSKQAGQDLEEIEQFLYESLYKNSTLVNINRQVRGWLTQAFEKLCSNPDLMPDYYRKLIDSEGLERTVCDYIAGMTDRYCTAIAQ